MTIIRPAHLPGDHRRSHLRSMPERAPSRPPTMPRRHQRRTAPISHATQVMEEMIQWVREAITDQRAVVARNLWRRVMDKDQIPPNLSGVSVRNKLFSVNNSSSKRQVNSRTHYSRDKSLSGIMGLGDRHSSLRVLSTNCRLKLLVSNGLVEKIPF